jgi:gliding motility-associated-like protein
MKKLVTACFFDYLTIILLSAVIIAAPKSLISQGSFKAEVRNTNCPVAGHEADRWYFGQNAGLDFRNQDPVYDPTNFLMNVPTSPAVMADSNGIVLFYTDGAKVYDRSGQVMANGDGLHGFVGYTMPVLIVPKPNSDSIYYIFTTHRPRQNQYDPQTIYGLEYNEVNLNRVGGLGEVTQKNVVLLQPEVSSRLSAVKHSNGIDYWVVGHRYDSIDSYNAREFCAFLVTENGVNASYVSSIIGSEHGGGGNWGDSNKGIGYLKISPDGTKLAVAIHGSDLYEIFNFNSSTGKVTDAITSAPIFDEAYGIEFSPDSRYLYGTTTSSSLPSPIFTPRSYLFQFDVNQGSAMFNVNNFDTVAMDTLGSYYGGIQLGTDGRIYVSRSPYGNAAVSVIANPKRPGSACNFSSNYIDLQTHKSRFGFPNFVQTYFALPHFDVENVCFEDGTLFILQNGSNVDNITWTFGDSGGGSNTSTDIQPTHFFTAAGTYTVSVTEYFNGVPYGPYTEEVFVNELPAPTVGDTVYMYPGSPILLDAGAGFVTYEWSTGESSQVVKVDLPGTYYVNVQNERCCFKLDSVLVLYFDVMVPNAFRPGGTNPVFKAYASSLDAINNFALYVFNRWGQQIFLSNDINVGWDGKVGGTDAPGDVYVWLVNYDVERSGKTVKIAYKGNVILLR